MRALVVHRPGAPGAKPVLTLKERPVPVLAKDSTQVLIKVRASKINPSDLLNVAGGFPYTTYPRIPGRDYAGTIVSSPGNTTLEGTNVFGTSGNQLGFVRDGAHAEFLVMDSDELVEMPATISFDQAACIGVPYTTALLMIRRAAGSGDQEAPKVLIIGGTGNVGTALAELLPALVPRSTHTSLSRVDGVLTLPTTEKFDIIFGTVPDTACLQAALPLLAKRGRLVYIACTRPHSEPLSIDPLQFYRDELSLIGVNSIDCTMPEATALMRTLSALISDGDLRVKQRAIRKVALTEGEGAYRDAGTSCESLVLTM
ncbi:Zinc-type alcohol dehydrogenase-like protein C337.11 [Taphrina deformans PYCC 5710]|uniref:Zinc-type alcohol dehydrogenase-like protein C337.11 n=1 Tax=Taphrina deformans (strain PYCC 5710 / ATCC 11124 / CBS 356.35 / IMI 108563 / JCM 9778 / NBRC 8474) TaxID=1097556 RepID=R4X6Y7_TAPDE|nr:Zinc-type alcohol dehydrogenase-like protein C337.11 [Taphrina deformans PYCC 5710]|eukprot:CCG80756.1 Zinc-type alcohol dehydrogenase-like protein C337.11 [Taphrina deformans PYCC 5710]